MGRITFETTFDFEDDSFTFHIDLDENETFENAVKLGIMLGFQAAHWHFKPKDPAYEDAIRLTLRATLD